MRKVIVALSAACLLPLSVQAKSLDDLLVEKGVITKGEAAGMMDSSGGARVYYNEGTRLEFPDSGFTARINTILRTRYTYTDNDNADNSSSFDVNNARLMLSGTALHNEFEYVFQSDMVGNTDGSGAKDPELLDAYLNWKPCDNGWMRMGQFKVMVSRQYITPVQKLMFPERSQVSEAFTLGRQPGLAGGMSTPNGMFSALAAVYNGVSDGEGINRGGVDTKHVGAVGVRYNPMGKMDVYSESDVDYTEDAATSIGFTYAFSDAQNDGFDSVETQIFNLDANLKVMGFGLNGEAYWSKVDQGDGTDTIEPMGFYVQAGYFVEQSNWELAGRYGFLDCDETACSSFSSGVLDKQHQVTAAVNYYWWKHQLKAQLAYDHISDDAVVGANDNDVNRWMFQLSSWF